MKGENKFMIENILKDKNIKLTSQQSEAVNFKEGFLLLLAVPGSGKTTSIICRNANLIINNILPKNICNITFSKAAAKEMESRFKRLFPEYETPHFSTIHSLSFQIVREFIRQKNIKFQIIEGNENTDNKINKKKILTDIFLRINKEYPNEDTIESVSSFISFVRNSLITPSDPTYSKTISDAKEKFNNPEDIYKTYMNIKKKNNWLDFDDMLCIANNILSENNLISRKYSNLFEFIQVDEAQDISKVQYEIIKKISKRGNLCFIADDDQTIYSWRGSDPKILLNLNKDFPELKIIYMEQNFRSAPEIVSKCNEFIKNNNERYKKNMFTQNKFTGTIKINEHNTVIKQSKVVINEIKELHDYNNSAILYRNNSSVLPIILECLKQNVPFNITINKNSILKPFILEDIISFYTFANDMSNKEAFLNICYKLNLVYLKKAELEKIVNKIEGNILDDLNFLKHINQFKLTMIKFDFKKLQNAKNVTSFLKILFNVFKYKEEIIKKTDENVIDILYALAEDEIKVDLFIDKIINLLNKIENGVHQDNSITLMTLHGSKGLEWKNVYLIDFSDNIIPNEKSDLEEERRLAYVGFSRAIKNLSINYYLESGDNYVDKSLFINEFIQQKKQQQNNLNSQNEIKNKKVIHKIFGRGTIIESSDNKIVVKFDKSGTRTMNKDLVLGEKILKII